jgi:hypothetical protein
MTMDLPARSPEISRSPRALRLLLGVAWALRVFLVLRGGQLYWPDEVRYLRSWDLWSRLAGRQWAQALDLVLNNPDHVGFLVGGLPLAAVHVGGLRLAGLPADGATLVATVWLPAIVLSLASVASIGLTYAVARRAGAAVSEALAAAILMACSSTQFYYSRHLLPYDLSMAVALAALWLGLGSGRSRRQFFLTGLLGGASFLIYNGYWLFAVACVGVALLRGGSPRGLPQRALLAGLGLAAGPAVLTLVGGLDGHVPFVVQMASFSRLAATQCDLSEGWRLPWAYLWHAEHGLLLLWLATAAATLLFAHRGPSAARSRALLWLGTWVAVYALIALLSTGLGRFGAFGRQVRALVPFTSLATAAAAASLLDGSRWAWARPGLASALAAQAIFNFAGPLRQRFPAEYARDAESTLGPLPREVAVSGPVVAGRAPAPEDRFVLVNAQHLYPVRGPRPVSSGGEVDRARHPLEFLPYQYEGYTPPERAVLRAADLSMRVLDRRPAESSASPNPAAGGRGEPPR